MLIVGICTLHVNDGVVRTEAGEGIDMAVCVVACEVAVIEPEDAVGVEIAKQTFLDLVARELRITIGGEETFAGSQQRALAIAFNATTFEDEIKMRLIEAMKPPSISPYRGEEFISTCNCTGRRALICKSLIDSVIKLGRELITPPVELEVEEAGASLSDEREEAVVTRPGVIGRTLEITDLRQQARGNALMQQGFDAIGLRRHDEQELIMHQDLEGDADITIVNLSENGRPVGVGVRPSELHTTLRIPLRREEGRAYLCLLRSSLLGKLEIQCEVADAGRGRGVVDSHSYLRFTIYNFANL